MLDKNLHLDRGMEELGEVQDQREFIFTENDPLVMMEKKSKEIEDQAQSVEEYDALMRPVNQEFGDAWMDSELFQYLETILRPHDLGKVETNLLEMLYNAFEHGSDFCRKGEVRVRVYLGKDKKVLIAVEQPGQGFDFETTFVEAQATERSGAAFHGGGMERVKKSEASFGFERVVKDQTNGFRALLLQSLKGK